MSRLAPGLVELNKGLDLNTAKIAAPEGTLLDSLNYEQVDFQGQKRIDGYARYDGSKGSYIDDFLRTSSFTDSSVADVVYVGSTIFGVVVGIRDGYADIAIIDETLINTVNGYKEWGRNLQEYTPHEHYELVLQYNEILRQRATTLPGPVAGLHWFRDRLYAVASVPAVPSEGLYPNDTWNGYTVLGSKDGVMYLGTADAIGTVGSSLASMFVALTETQAEQELGGAYNYGWHFKHLGWTVPFENGVSLYGSIAALNQNKQNIGVQGPTSTEGTRGRFLHLTQDVSIQGKPTQARGWKSTTTPTTYDLNPADLYDIDNRATYADAYVSWNGSTKVISAPGITGAVPEYSASATVKVLVL